VIITWFGEGGLYSSITPTRKAAFRIRSFQGSVDRLLGENRGRTIQSECGELGGGKKYGGSQKLKGEIGGHQWGWGQRIPGSEEKKHQKKKPPGKKKKRKKHHYVGFVVSTAWGNKIQGKKSQVKPRSNEVTTPDEKITLKVGKTGKKIKTRKGKEGVSFKNKWGHVIAQKTLVNGKKNSVKRWDENGGWR